MFRSASNFDKLLDKATSNLKLEPDWPTILKICDLIRQGDVQPKYALAAIKKKMFNENPHTAMFGLMVLESCVKNCGNLIHDEIGTAGYMTQLRELIKTTNQEDIKNKVLELIQAWAFAFRNAPKYRAVLDTMNILKAEDYKFPALKESDAMFSADTAPEWADADCCHRCRVQFGMVQRKHHCRACGQVFCNQCSSKNCTLPKFGIEKEVRVCDACYNNNSKSTKSSTTPKSEDLPAEYLNSSLAQQNQAPPPRKSEDELREEEELQLALALSQSEAEQKDKQKLSQLGSNRAKTYSPPPAVRTSSPPEEDVDPELARYLNRPYWENRQQQEDNSSPSAPASLSSPMPTLNTKQTNVTVEQNGVESEAQMEQFVHALQSQVEIFINRMKSNSSRGRSITNDSSVQTLFMNITAMHSKLLRYIQQQDDSRVYYEGLQDKLAQVKDARAALNALREEHREKLRREAEMAERQRQLQMAQKLDIMRKKKQEYLQYQRQLALQRIQEQEREMQMRQEQQKQQYLIGSYNKLGYIPSGANFDKTSLPSAANMVMPPPPPPHHQPFPPPTVAPNYNTPFPQPGLARQLLPPTLGPGYMIAPNPMLPPGMMGPPHVGPPGQMHSLPPAPGTQPIGQQPQMHPQLGSQGLPAPPLSQGQHMPPNMGQPPPSQMSHMPQTQPPLSQGHPPMSLNTTQVSIAPTNQSSAMITAPSSQNAQILPPPTSQNASMMPPAPPSQSAPMLQTSTSQNPQIIPNSTTQTAQPHMVAGAPPMMMPPHLTMQPLPQTFQPQPPPQVQPPPQQQPPSPQLQENQNKPPETAELISFD
ncbi:hepatocyte growth factor regulated tyrosine kinase substrate isoform X1 [Lycorma delicatula]|uniref:hepatocyte growth factor regulated tyrosine kinase substrate isoform X1 n=2 Tax=Lycorma delicatula TaxID=130591 RepID=UPI003F50D605